MVGALLLGTLGCSDARDRTPGAAVVDNGAPSTASVSGSQEGEFVTYVADFEDGHSERSFALRRDDGSEMPLSFDTDPMIVTGTRVRLRGQTQATTGYRVRGELAAQAFQVNDVETLSVPQVESTPVNAAPPSPDTYALVLVDLGSGVNMDAGSGNTAMFSTTPTDKSFASFYYESSYGKYSVTGAVVGPYTYSMTTCNTTGMYQTIEMANSATLSQYKHLIYYFSKTNLCTFGGLGEEGSQSMPAKRTWMNGSLSCVVLMQEPGHNLGMMHANTIACDGGSFSTTPGTSCTITEYGSGVTPMGSGCHQLNGYEKWYEQWLTGCNGIRVTSTGSFNLVPLGESCPGAVQVLQIPMPATLTVNDPQATTTNVSLKDYYVELRAAAGTFDQYSAGRGGGFGGGVTYSAPTVYVYASDDVHSGVSTGRGGGGASSVWTELMNMTPGSTSFTGLTAAGSSFKDPAGGATITLQSISATGAIVNVTVPNGTGGPTCIDGTTLMGGGSSCDGGAVVIPPFDGGTTTTPEAGASSSGGGGSADATTSSSGGGSSSSGGGSSGGNSTDGGTTSGGSSGGAGSSNGGNGGNGSGGSQGGSGGNSQGSSGAGASSDDAAAGNASVWTEAAKPAGCGCETVGRTSGRDIGGLWLGIGALALGGCASRRSRREKAKGSSGPGASSDA